MERHGHFQLAPEVRTTLLAMSAATIDRALREIRQQAGTAARRRSAPTILRFLMDVSIVPRRNRFASDSPLEEAVSSELVSEADFPASREVTENFIDWGSRGASTPAKRALGQRLTSQFPTHPNREFFAVLQGI
jgi:hypothetical protein